MNIYEKPEITEIIEIEDVITTSPVTPDIDNGSTIFPESWLQL